MNSSLMFSVSNEKFLLFLQFAKNDDTPFLRVLRTYLCIEGPSAQKNEIRCSLKNICDHENYDKYVQVFRIRMAIFLNCY